MTIRQLMDNLARYDDWMIVTNEDGYTITDVFIHPDSDNEELTLEFENTTKKYRGN